MPKLAIGENILVRTSVSTEFKYDSNIFSRGQSQGPVEDYVVQLTPQIEVLNQRRAFTLGGKYIPTGYYYLKNQQRGTLAHFASIDMKVQPSEKTTFGVNEAIRYTKESREAFMTGIQTKNMGILSNDITLNMAHEFSPAVSITASLSDAVLEFEDPSAIDSRTDSAGIASIFKATESTAVNADYTFTRFSFGSFPDNSHIETHLVTLGFNTRLSPTADLNFSAGVTHIPSSSKEYEWTANAGFRKTFQRSSINMGYSRTTTNTSGLTNLLNVSERYSAGLDHVITNSIDIGAYGNYSKNRTSPTGLVDLTSYEAGIKGNWRIYPWMTLGAGYSHFQQGGNASLGEDIRRDQVFVNVTATPSEWRF